MAKTPKKEEQLPQGEIRSLLLDVIRVLVNLRGTHTADADAGAALLRLRQYHDEHLTKKEG